MGITGCRRWRLCQKQGSAMPKQVKPLTPSAVANARAKAAGEFPGKPGGFSH